MVNRVDYNPEKFDADEYGNLIPKTENKMPVKKYKVIERFTVDLISEVDAENENEAKYLHLNRVGELNCRDYTNECDNGAGNSTYEIEEL